MSKKWPILAFSLEKVGRGQNWPSICSSQKGFELKEPLCLKALYEVKRKKEPEVGLDKSLCTLCSTGRRGLRRGLAFSYRAVLGIGATSKMWTIAIKSQSQIMAQGRRHLVKQDNVTRLGPQEPRTKDNGLATLFTNSSTKVDVKKEVWI